MTNEEFEGKIKTGLSKLDHENDAHWTKAGKPDIAAVCEASGLDELKRADIEKVAPDYERREVIPQDEVSNETCEFERETIESTSNRARLEKQNDGKTGRKMSVFKELPKKTRVRATERGYYGGEVKEPGDVFSVTGRPGSWMEPA